MNATHLKYREKFIERVGARVKVRLLSPDDLEALETLPEADREAESLLQGIYDPAEFSAQMALFLKKEAVTAIVSNDPTRFYETLRHVKWELLDAVTETNSLGRSCFQTDETLTTGSDSCGLHLDKGGHLLISHCEPA